MLEISYEYNHFVCSGCTTNDQQQNQNQPTKQLDISSFIFEKRLALSLVMCSIKQSGSVTT